ncbi:hypothetical protein STENM223S_09322 [Streptomyces tendae]
MDAAAREAAQQAARERAAEAAEAAREATGARRASARAHAPQQTASRRPPYASRTLGPMQTSSDRHEYPAHWEADVVLRDGGTARVRPITVDDAERLVSFYEQVSDESKYYRFFAPYPRLSAKDVHRFTHHDFVDRVGLAATVGDEFIGTVRYDRIGAGGAARGRRGTPTRPRSPSWCRTPTRAGASPPRCWSTSPRSPASATSAGSPPRCCPPTPR